MKRLFDNNSQKRVFGVKKLMSDSLDVDVNVASQTITIDGHELLHVLGEGGGGTVFKAKQKSTGQAVAIKLLGTGDEKSPLQTERLEARFEREVQLAAQLHHPHIVTLLGSGKTNEGHHYAAFEYVPGETLKDLLARKGMLPAIEAGDLMGQVLDALACAHEQGIAHRDLKPQNIMLSVTGTCLHVKILDFGIAAYIPERQKADYRNLTMTAEMMCSPSYSAPEHLRGEPPTLKTDLYAWGLLFIECLTGRPAIEGVTLADIFHQQLSRSEITLPPALACHPLGDLLRRSLRKNPLERVESATALYQEFKKINLANIVGDLSSPRGGMFGSIIEPTDNELTQRYVPGSLDLVYQQQQLSVLSCSIEVRASEVLESEVLEALQRDQLNLCMDTASRYGGHLAGELGNSLLFYFGYPHVAEDDVRRCARAALEHNSQVRQRNGLLQRQGSHVELRMGIHTGMVSVLPGQLPTGLTPSTAIQLERLTARGEISVSAASRQILEQYVEFESAKHQLQKSDGLQMSYSSLKGELHTEASFLMRSEGLSHRIIGREGELLQLQKIWERAQGGEGQALLLRGEAGVGKSRLAYEMCVNVRQQGGAIVEIRCLAEGQNNALQAVLGYLKSRFSLEGVDTQVATSRLVMALEEATVSVENVLPILCSWLGLPIPTEYPLLQFSAERQKNLLLVALVDLLLQLAQNHAVLILMEDMHWVDQTSQELLNLLLQASEKQSILLLMTSRPYFNSPWSDLEIMEVEGLRESAAGQLVSNILGGKVIDHSDLRRLCLRTDGIPLFIEELTRMLLDKQLLCERTGVYQLDARFDTSDIPITLRGLLGARLTRLGRAKETAQLAATIGREFDYAILRDVSLADEGCLQADLEQLAAVGLILRQRRVQGDSYVFRHALIRDAAYDAAPKKQREQIHARIAHYMVDAGSVEIEQNLSPLARHFGLALEYDDAVNYGTKASQSFLQKALAAEAIAQIELVQSWLPHIQGAEYVPTSLTISRVLTTALMSKYGWGDDRVKLQAERELSFIDGGVEVLEAIPTLWGLVTHHHTRSHRDTARILIEQLVKLASQSGDTGAIVASNNMNAFAFWLEGNYVQSLSILNQVINDYDFESHRNHCDIYGLDTLTVAMVLRSNIKWFAGLDDSAAHRDASEAVTYGRKLNHLPSLGLAMLFQALNYQYAGNVEKTLTIAQELRELSLRYSLPALEGWINILYAWCTSDLEMCDEALAFLRQLSCMSGYTYYASLAAEIAARSGDYHTAFVRIDECVELSEKNGEPYYKPELLIRRANYRVHTPVADSQKSRDDLQWAVDLAQSFGMSRSVRNASAYLSLYE